MGDIYRQRMMNGSSKPHINNGKLKPPCPCCKKPVSRDMSGKITRHNNGNKMCKAANMTDAKFIELWEKLLKARRSSFN